MIDYMYFWLINNSHIVMRRCLPGIPFVAFDFRVRPVQLLFEVVAVFVEFVVEVEYFDLFPT